MSSTLRNGETRDLNLTASDYITLVAVSGTYTATVVRGNSSGTVLGTNVTGGTYGPYTGGAVIRVVTSASSEIDFDIGASPVIVSDTYVTASTNPVTGGIEKMTAGDSFVLTPVEGKSKSAIYLTPNIKTNPVTLNSNWRTTLSVPADFDAIQVGVINVDTVTPVTGIKVAISPSDSILNNGSVPTLNGVRDDTMWKNVTFSGVASGNAPINPYVIDVQYVAPVISWSDEIQISSIPRVDVIGGQPLALVSVYLPAVGVGNLGYASVTGTPDAYEAATGRTLRFFNQNGSDRTSTPANWTGSGADSYSFAVVIPVLRFLWRGNVVSFAGFGDSTFQGTGATAGVGWITQVLNKSGNNISFFNGGVTGDRGTAIVKRIRDCIKQVAPNFLIYQLSPINDGTLTDVIVAAQKLRALQVIDYAKNNGIRVILVSPMPSSNSAQTALVQARYLQLLDFTNSFDTGSGVTPLDISAVHLTPGQWQVGFNSGDGFHPNDTATAVLVSLLKTCVDSVTKYI